MARRPSTFTAALATAAALVLMAGAATPASAATAPPADGTAYFGVFLGSGDTPADYVSRSGLRPAQYGQFAHLPMPDAEKQSLSAEVDAIRAQNARLFLTVEPTNGLAAVTDTVAADLAATLAGYNQRGVEVSLRFAHEMNGSWYPWGQQPAAYIAAFRRVASAVHATAPGTSMVWSPNYGGGYPFTGGTYAAKAGSADFTLLDTNGNGGLSMADDPYTPYYPGDAYVDWMGLTLYHFGNAWPYGENETPEAGKFAQQLQGTYNGNGLYEDQSALPDYYQSVVARQKPLVISETGALYNETPPKAGNSELEIKSSWIKQVYGSTTRSQFPLLKAVNWFEIRKFESEANGTVDWRATANPSVADVLRSQVTTGGYLFAGSTTPTPTSAPTPTPPPTPTVTTPSAPTSLVASANPSRVTLSWKAPAATGGAPVTSYVACRAGTTTCLTVAATTTTATFDGLARKTAYTFTVRAANSAGSGTAATVSATTK